MFYKRFNVPFNTNAWTKDPEFTKRLCRSAYGIKCVYAPAWLIGIPMVDVAGGGAITCNKEFPLSSVIKAFHNLKSVGININIIVNNPYQDYDVKWCIKRLKSLWQSGLIDSITVPSASWIDRDYLPITYKNTVVHVPTFDDVRDGLWDDYDMVYVHDEIIHNHDKWKAIKGSRKFGCIVNLGYCYTKCPAKKEHYQFVNNKIPETEFCPYLNDEFKPVNILQRAIIPLIRSEYEYYLDVIDEYKFCGRDTTNSFYMTLDIIEALLGNTELPREPAYAKIKDLDRWKVHVRNCGGDCFAGCRYCERSLL